jgi:glutamyl-tRNA reductase
VLVIVGLSHRNSPLEVRESLAIPVEGLRDCLQRLREATGLQEALILSTCNRVELYGEGPDEDGAEAALARFLPAFHGKPMEDVTPFLYRLRGAEAVRHAFRVPASLDSMVLGEPQILGQVKEAYRAAAEAGTLGATLGGLRNRALAAAKRVRAETGIGAGAVSVSSVAVELARKIFGDLRERNVLLVGTGKMSELSVRQLVSAGARATVIGMRTLDRAHDLAAALGGRAASLEGLADELARADVVISSTAAPGFVIRESDVERARRARSARPLFLIDIAVPRDIEPTAGRLNGVFVYDLDDLHAVADANLRERRKEAAAAEALVDREVREFIDWRASLEAVPLLVELRRRGDEVRRAELDKVRARLGPLTPEQEQALEAATSALVAKLLHAPTVYLKEMARNGHAAEAVALVRRLLGL